LGEVGKSSVELQAEGRPPMADRVTAVHKSAALMTVLAVTDGVAGENRPNRTLDNTRAFFDNTRDALLNDTQPAALPDGPRQQTDAYAFAGTVGRWLRMEEGRKEDMIEPFNGWRDAWLQQLAQSAPDRRDPRELLSIAEEIGLRCTQMGAVMLLGFNGHGALRQLGAIGGVEEHGTDPFGAVRRGMHTYTTALVEQHGGVEGLRRAQEMRQAEETALYHNGLVAIRTARQRRVFDTVTWFAMRYSALSRRRQGLEGRHMARTARHLEVAVQAAA
jgi:hypothetical protein